MQPHSTFLRLFVPDGQKLKCLKFSGNNKKHGLQKVTKKSALISKSWSKKMG